MNLFLLWVDPCLKPLMAAYASILDQKNWAFVDNITEADAFLATENFCLNRNILEMVGANPLIIYHSRDTISEFSLENISVHEDGKSQIPVLSKRTSYQGNNVLDMFSMKLPTISQFGETIPEFILEDISTVSLTSVIEEFTPICQKLRQLGETTKDARYDVYYAGLLFIWSRGSNLQPIITPKLNNGFGYPYFDTVIRELDDRSVSGVDIFSFLEESGYLVSTPIEMAHTCPKCQSIMLMLRDSCMSCSSQFIQEEILVHHFSCGYQASESHYLVSNDILLNEYVCPKCRKPLRHYGVDYDKPGVIYHCSQCNHDNSETEVALRCMSCCYMGTANDSKKISIFSYELSNQGRRTVVSGETNVFNVRRLLRDSLSLVPFDIFCLILEKLASLRSCGDNIILTIELNSIDTSLESPKDTKTLIELGKVVMRNIRKSDTVSLYQGALFVLFADIELTEVDRIIAKKKADLSEVLEPELLNFLSFKTIDGQEFLQQVGGM